MVSSIVDIFFTVIFGVSSFFIFINLYFDNSITLVYRLNYVFLLVVIITFFLTQELNIAVMCLLWLSFSHSNKYFAYKHVSVFFFILTIFLIFVTEIQSYYIFFFLYYTKDLICNSDKQSYVKVAFLLVSCCFFLLLSMDLFWNELYFVRFFFFFLTFFPGKKTMILMYLDLIHWLFICKDVVSLAGYNWISIVIYSSIAFECIHYWVSSVFHWNYFYLFSPLWTLPALLLFSNIWVTFLQMSWPTHFNQLMIKSGFVEFHELDRLLSYRPEITKSIVFKRFAWKFINQQVVDFGRITFSKMMAKESVNLLKNKLSNFKLAPNLAFLGSGLVITDWVGKKYLGSLNFRNDLTNLKKKQEYLVAYSQYEIDLKQYHIDLELYKQSQNQGFLTKVIHNLWIKKPPMLYPSIMPLKPQNFITIPNIPEEQWVFFVYHVVITKNRSLLEVNSLEDLV